MSIRYSQNLNIKFQYKRDKPLIQFESHVNCKTEIPYAFCLIGLFITDQNITMHYIWKNTYWLKLHAYAV